MRAIIVVLTGLGFLIGTVARCEIQPEFALDSDPKLTPPDPVIIYPEKHRPLWLAALARPEADLQRRAAQAIADAHLLGTPNLGEARPLLIKIVAADQTHRAARLAAVKALIVLDARESASTLFEASQKHGLDLRQVIEPALAKWNHEAIYEIWRQRFSSKETRHRDLMLAINGLAEVRDESSAPALLAVVHDGFRPAAVRLAAARAVGRMKQAGLEPDALQLLMDDSSIGSISNRLCSAALLDQHRSDAAWELLSRLGTDAEPSVAAAALRALNATNPDRILPLAERAMRNSDANVRREGVTAYAQRPTAERVVFLAKLLDDLHPDVRRFVRETLFQLAQKEEFDTAIRSASTDVLAAESWRGQEQAALLLAALDHKPVAGRLVQLLDSPREEVMVASAWALRKLAIAETLPGIHDKVLRETERRAKTGLSAAGDAQVAHLCEILGLLKFAPAEPVLRRYIAKNYSMGEQSRSSAIWALGHLHTGKPDEALARLLIERMTEPASAIPPEMTRVRFACAISLGRMHAKSQMEAMRKQLGPVIGSDPMSLVIRWAIQEMSGETLPEPERPVVLHEAGWFLESLD